MTSVDFIGLVLGSFAFLTSFATVVHPPAKKEDETSVRLAMARTHRA